MRERISECLYEQNVPCSFFQSIVLMHIGENQPCTAHHIVDTTRKDKAQITRLVNELVKNHFITREQNPNDKRQYWLCLTPFGTQTFQHISKIRNILSQQVLQNLGEEQQQQATQILIRMSENLNAEQSR